MALCINQSGTWRVITTQCVNQSGTWRKVVTGCINDSGTWRRFGFTIIPTVTLTASPTTISQGSSSTLTWSSTNATAVTSSNFGATTVTGSTSVSPSSSTNYTITVQSSTGNTASANTTVAVVPPPTFSYFFASPSTISQGSSSTLYWDTNNATAVTTSNFGATTVTGTKSVSPSSTTTYTITVRNSFFVTATATTTITVYTLATAPLGTTNICGGTLICRNFNNAWIVAPNTSEVRRTWYCRGDSVIRAQQVTGCTGWFVPDSGQLYNPGWTCRAYWDNQTGTTVRYWSDSGTPGSYPGPGVYVQFGNFSSGTVSNGNRSSSYPVRAFRCVSY